MSAIDFKDLELKVEEAVKKGELSRRDALKVMAFASGGMLLSGDDLLADQNASGVTAPKKSSKAKIVIVGGGSAGITVAARLFRKIDNPDVTIIEPSEQHVYQPGQTLVGAGVFEKSQLVRSEKDFIPLGAKWLKQSVTQINPEGNYLKTDKGEQIGYDYLVVAPGLQLDYDKIDGLKDNLGKNGICSVYTLDDSQAAWELNKAFKGGNAIFTNPATPIKCGGAPQKVMYLFDDYLRQNNLRDKAKMYFNTAGAKYFAIPEFDEAAQKISDSKQIIKNFKHNLVAVDAAKKEATFEKKLKVKVGVDKETKEDVFEEKAEKVVMQYDFLHVVPPMSAPKFLQDTSLVYPGGTAKGWLKVDRFTLQHFAYKNVFGIGDVIGTPFGKTGGSVRKQAPVLVENMLAAMEGKELTHKYNGYTVCPLITKRGTVMLAEFDYDGKPAPSFPLDPTKERWIWWLLKVYLLPPMYWYGMLRGRA